MRKHDLGHMATRPLILRDRRQWTRLGHSELHVMFC